MNEQIKKLADSIWSLDIEPNEQFNKSLQEFAELIIRECIDICLRNHINNIETISAGECAYDIQEHFGVD
jgi:hypothetical protein